MNPLVTVVIPTFNRKQLIFRALDSVTKQSYRPLEVVVVDDCSSDGTVEALHNADFPFPVKVVAMETNQGPAAARNAGILKASGKYVAFLDSDDSWFPEKLERQVTFLESSSNPECTVMYSQVWIQRPYETLLRPVRAKADSEPIADYVFANGGYLDQNTIMLSIELARAVMYKPEMRLHEDWDFYMRLEQHGVAFAMLEMPLGITYDNSSVGRASAAQPMRSVVLLEEWRPKISRRAYYGLRARIAPQLRQQAPMQACRFIFDGYRHRAISPWMALALVGSLVHPHLRQFAYYIRGKLARRTSGVSQKENCPPKLG